MSVNVTRIDWVIIGVFFVVLLGLAIYINSLCRSVADYLVSARKVRMWLGIGAGIAGEIGLVSIAGMCEQGYRRGYSFTLLQIFSLAITVPLFGIWGFGIQRFRASKAMSVPQYIEMRFSKRLRVITGYTNCLAGVIQMSIFPIIGARFLAVLMKLPETISIAGVPMKSVLVLMGLLLLCNIVFTYLGGSITMTVTNFFMMIIIMGAICWLMLHLIAQDGLQSYWTKLENNLGKAGFYPFTGAEGSYGMLFFLWSMLMSILLQFSYGPYLQKYASMDKPKTVSRSYFLGAMFVSGRLFLVMGFGVATLAALGNAIPADFHMDKADWGQMATAYHLARHTPPILMGFWLSCLLFADISSTDQYLLSWSTSIVNDCIMPLRKRPFEPRAHIRAVRLTIIALCVFFFFVGMIYKPTMPIWEFLWLIANIIGGTGIAVLFGMYWKRANTAGAYAAIACNVAIPIGDQIARYVYSVRHPTGIYPILPQQTGFWAYILGIILLVVVSLLTKKEDRFWDLGKAVREMNAAETGGPTGTTNPTGAAA